MFQKLFHARAAAVAGIVLAVGLNQARADILSEWTEEWFDTIRAFGGPPCPIARNQAMVYTAIYEAINSIDRQHEPYIGFVDVKFPVNSEIAVAAAAHKVLVSVYPQRAAVYDDLYATQRARFRNAPRTINGIALGEAAADQIIAARATDRTDSEPEYVYRNKRGSYRPTPPDFTTPASNPGWGATAPWCIPSGDHFRPTGPLGFFRLDALLRSAGYAEAVNEVKRLGRRNSSDRTAEQTEIAWFWANDRNGTYKPPGQLMEITQTVAEQEGLSLEDKTRLYALAAMAMGDAGLVSWDMKFATNIDLWRPVTAIRNADQDNNPATAKNGAWLPLLDFTPNFPAYTSGHGTFASAHAAVMQRFFGTDEMTFTVHTDEPIVSNVTRTFHRFSDAAREDGLSRIYLGVHFRFDADSAFSSGTLLGNYIMDHMLLPRNCSADMNQDGRVNSADMRVFNEAYFAGVLLADLDQDNQVTTADYQLFVTRYFAGCE